MAGCERASCRVPAVVGGRLSELQSALARRSDKSLCRAARGHAPRPSFAAQKSNCAGCASQLVEAPAPVLTASRQVLVTCAGLASANPSPTRATLVSRPFTASRGPRPPGTACSWRPPQGCDTSSIHNTIRGGAYISDMCPRQRRSQPGAAGPERSPACRLATRNTYADALLQPDHGILARTSQRHAENAEDNAVQRQSSRRNDHLRTPSCLPHPYPAARREE